MEVLRNGKFSLPISAVSLSKGLRPSANLPINTHTLTTCAGVVGVEGVLQRMGEMLRNYPSNL